MMVLIMTILRFQVRYVNKFPLIFLRTTNHHTNDIPPVHRKLRRGGYQIRIGECPEMKFICGQEKNNQRDCGIRPRSQVYRQFLRQRVCSKYAHYQRTLRFEGTTTIFQEKRHDVTPSSWNVLTPRYEIEITKPLLSRVIFLLLFLFVFCRCSRFAFSREQIG